MNKLPILIDCDTGTDDAIAIVAALFSDEVDVKAFTTVDGNVALKYTCRNTLDLVRYLGFDTKVAVGAPHAIIGNKTEDADVTHGKQGLGTLTLPHTDSPFYEKTAVETIYETAKECGGELVLVPVGPLTNIALALMAHPDLKDMIKKIVLMGGAIWGGNSTTTAEFNIWVDPEAAHIVFSSGVPVTMVGLDVTTKACLDQTDIDFMRGLGTKAGDFTANMLDFMMERVKEGGEDLLMHDALALAVAVKPELVKCGEYFVDCECRGTYTRGHTHVDVRGRSGKPANCLVAEELDLEAFRTWLRNAVAGSQKVQG